MSRLARLPLPVPSAVQVQIGADGSVNASGPQGKLTLPASSEVKVELADASIKITRVRNTKHARSMEGTYVRRIANLFIGVADGFERVLELVGVGYRAQMQGNKLHLMLGLSNPVLREVPEGLSVSVASPTEIVIKGIDKQVVGQFAAEIRALRPPEPYKGKGIRHRGERVIMKEAKKTK